MYKVIKSFRGSPDGCRVIDFGQGESLVENTNFPADLIEVALAEGWVKEVKPAAKKRAVKK